jgi:hypothetical protein
VLRTSLLGWMTPKGRWLLPPVPTTNSLIPYARSAAPSGVWGGEALVVVVVAVQDHLCARRVQDVPARSHPGVVAVFGAGAEEGVVEVGQSARLGVSRQVLLEPADHRRVRPVAAHLLAHGVQRDDVPGPEIVGVVALQRVARGGAEVAEVTRGASRLVLVVAHSGQGARLVASPEGP